MIIGIGVDLIENRRIKRELALGGWRSDDVFTADEIKLCRHSRNPELRYAAWFAAKEAVLKALGTRVQDLGMFREVEVHPCSSCEYEILLRGRALEELDRLGARRILLSIATGKEMTAAFAILEG